MITPEKAQQDYEAAVAALRQGAKAPGVSTADRMAALDAIDQLTVGFLGQIANEIHALTDQYKGFITTMTAVIATLRGGATPVSVLNRLTGIVEGGAQLVTAVGGILQPGAKGLPGAGRATRVARATRSARAVPSGTPLKLLCIHGVGHAEADADFESSWQDAISRGLNRWSPRPFVAEFFGYDELFDDAGLNAAELMKAVFKLTASGIFHGIGDAITGARVNAFRSIKIFHEHVVNRVLQDFVAACNPVSVEIEGDFHIRGNIKTVIRASYRRDAPRTGSSSS